MAVLTVAAAALLGLIAGRYVREFSGRFAVISEGAVAAEGDGVKAENVAADSVTGWDADVNKDPGGGSAERGSAAIAGTRGAEAREAFRAVSRTVPVPAWPPTVELATAAVCGLVVWRLGGQSGWLLAAWLYLAVVGMALTVIDWRTRRLPDVLTLPSYVVLLGLLAPSGAMPQAIYGMLGLGAVYAVLWFVRPDALGLGDVKLAGLIGLATGALGLQSWVVAAVGGHLLGALYALGLLITRRGTLKSEFPFGPFMLAAALAALLVAR
ncbi:A24 family peptidase [Thermopolyspora sp. NPDC052614]|uniref:prepilin peptidase n=1 Tax=Thermopolyspora sp. NPDC052614 TaxID=3155682 RepID=UPI00341FB312